MLKNRIIPCLDVKDGRVVKGVNFVGLRDAGDPVEQARIYDEAGADELCFLDISASHENRDIILDVVTRTAEVCFMPLTVGGGVRNLDDIRRLLLAGDSAHIVPPTGAKGLNMAIGDVQIMTRALKLYFEEGSTTFLDKYSDTCLKRVWQVQRFASMLCYNLHRFPDHNQFEHKMQLAELNNMTHSIQAMRAFAQSYTGLPVELFYDLE